LLFFFKRILNSIYEDGDGSISWEELGYVMKTLGHKVSEPQLKKIMKLIDENGIYLKLFKHFLIKLSLLMINFLFISKAMVSLSFTVKF